MLIYQRRLYFLENMEDLCGEIIKKYPNDDIKSFENNTKEKIIIIF
jgi:hypothetical protein